MMRSTERKVAWYYQDLAPVARRGADLRGSVVPEKDGTVDLHQITEPFLEVARHPRQPRSKPLYPPGG
jgi:hypothetical protein